jgi:CRISPR/Cas system-associated protein endoribonuclease Cas2
MNKLIPDNIHPRAHKILRCRNQSNEKSQIGQLKPIFLNNKSAIENAYAFLRRISDEFNILVVDQTFGKGIVRVSCRTIAQLDNIPLITKELLKFRLIVEIGMEPLEYSVKMHGLILFFKPTDAASRQKLDRVFQKYSLTSFNYNYRIIDIEYPVVRKGSFKSKRISVKKAHSSLRQILKAFNTPCLKDIFGSGIVRVCCRSVVQLDNIAFIMQTLLELCLIKEVRMPLEYSYKMRSLVIFLKPVNYKSGKKLIQVFRKSSFKYHQNVIDIEYPAAAAIKETLRKRSNCTSNITLTKPDYEDTKQILMDNKSNIIMFVTIISIMLTYALSKI